MEAAMDRFFYVFWDYDDEADKELDISEGAFSELIDTCFQYADSFAVTYSLRGFNVCQRMDETVCHHIIATKAIPNGYVRCFFKCCPETKRYLLESYHCLFGWYWTEKRERLPENLAFYRSDGSSFFASETHEGKCYLYPRNGEDFSSVWKSEGWCLGAAGGGCLPSYMELSWLNPQPNNLPESSQG